MTTSFRQKLEKKNKKTICRYKSLHKKAHKKANDILNVIAISDQSAHCSVIQSSLSPAHSCPKVNWILVAAME